MARQSISLGQRLAFAAKAAAGIFSSKQTAQAAQGLLAGIMPGGSTYSAKRGTKDLLQLYDDSPIFRMIVGSIARRFAALDWHVMAPTGRPGSQTRTLAKIAKLQRSSDDVARRALVRAMQDEGELVELTEHPMARLLEEPNPLMTGEDWRRLYMIYTDTVGEFFGVWNRNGFGVPVEIYPIPPHWVASLPLPGDPYYRVQFSGWNKSIGETEMVYWRDFDPVNPYGRGSGTGRAAFDELMSDESAAKHVAGFFENRARPDVLIYGELGSPERVREAEQKWLDKLGGFWRANLPHFLNLPPGVQIQELSQDFQSMQMVELRTRIRDAVRQLYGVPPEVLGIVENSNRATIEASDYLMDRGVIVPRAETFRAQLQRVIEPAYGESRIVIEYDSPIREDQDRQNAVMIANPWAFTADEIRQRGGEDPLPDGKGEVHPVGLAVTFQRELTPSEDFGADYTPPPADGGEVAPPAPAVAPEEEAQVRSWLRM